MQKDIFDFETIFCEYLRINFTSYMLYLSVSYGVASFVFDVVWRKFTWSPCHINKTNVYFLIRTKLHQFRIYPYLHHVHFPNCRMYNYGIRLVIHSFSGRYIRFIFLESYISIVKVIITMLRYRPSKTFSYQTNIKSKQAVDIYLRTRHVFLINFI